MDSENIGLIIAFFVCLLFSAFFSSTETAFSSANRIRLKSMSDDGNKRAEKALKVIDDYDALLSSILIGNNIVNIAMASIATVICVSKWGDIGATISTVITTLLVLIFAEITPKSLAKEIPEKFSMAVAPVMRVFVAILTPVNFLFTQWKNLIKKIFHLESNQSITEGEFLTMVEEAENEGGIDEADGELIRSVIEFNDVDAGEILTPRVDVVAISKDSTVQEIRNIFVENEYSRLPVYEEDIDDIIGFIHRHDFNTFVYTCGQPVSDIMKPVMYVPPTMKISKILQDMQKKHMHMVVVSDEFGGTEGILTMEDILEELVGEIYDEHDEDEKISEFEKISEDEYRIKCTADLEDMFEFFKLSEDLDEEFESNTVSGWVLEQLDKMPSIGDSFTYENLYVVVTNSDERRVLEITVKVLAPKEEEKVNEKLYNN